MTNFYSYQTDSVHHLLSSKVSGSAGHLLKLNPIRSRVSRYHDFPGRISDHATWHRNLGVVSGQLSNILKKSWKCKNIHRFVRDENNKWKLVNMWCAQNHKLCIHDERAVETKPKNIPVPFIFLENDIMCMKFSEGKMHSTDYPAPTTSLCACTIFLAGLSFTISGHSGASSVHYCFETAACPSDQIYPMH